MAVLGVAVGKGGGTQTHALGVGRARRLPRGPSRPSPLLSGLGADAGQVCLPEGAPAFRKIQQDKATLVFITPFCSNAPDPFDPSELAGASGLCANVALRGTQSRVEAQT